LLPDQLTTTRIGRPADKRVFLSRFRVALHAGAPAGSAVPGTPIEPINFPFWVPEGARATLSGYYDLTYSERDHRYMLRRLATHHSMEEAWIQLISLENITPDVLVTWTFVIWLSARELGQLVSESRGSKSRLRKVRKKLSAPLQYSEMTRQAYAFAEKIESLDPQIRAANGITNETLKEHRRVADFFKREDDAINFWPGLLPLPRKLVHATRIK
jgi:hypothetical protein